MAGKRKAEGIALLSVYGGDDDDGASQASSSDEEGEATDGENVSRLRDSSSPQADIDLLGSGGARAYGTDGEPQLATESLSGARSTSPGNLAALQQLENNAGEGLGLQSGDVADGEDRQGGAVDGEKGPEANPKECDILDGFLPPIPAEKYTGELQTKFFKYLALKKTGKSLNEQLRNTKGYRNPDFLQSAVRHYDIDHIGTCFKKEIFNPHGYDPSDYYDSIASEIRRETDRKEMEKRQSQRIDFVRNNIQAAVAVAKPGVQVLHKVTTTVTTSETMTKMEGRSSKKSKWDKVDINGGRAQTMTNPADAIAAANAHAALLTASANAGAGYASFAQQRRREAEEKIRITEKLSSSGSSKLDRKTERGS